MEKPYLWVWRHSSQTTVTNQYYLVMTEKYSFEEFKLMYESTEKVTDRRLSNNKLNYTIGVAILVSIGIIWKWSVENEKYFFCGLLLVFLLAGLAALFCSLWIGQIKDFKKLNAAKFDVINEMSNRLYFDCSDTQVDLKSYMPFTKEWEKLLKINALQENHKSNLVVLKSSNTEFFIPIAFRFIFIVVTLASLVTIIINPNQTWQGIQFLLHLK